MSISNFYTIIDVNFKFSTRPKSETIIPRYQNYERMAIQTKILNAGSEKSTKIRVRGQIHVKKRREPKLIFHVLITGHWKSVRFLFKKENKCSMFLPPN